MPKVKAKTTTFATRREFENAVDKVAILQLEAEKKIADFNKEAAFRDKVFKAWVKTRNAKLNALATACESYAAHHREELLGGKQTGETKLAFFGFRKSPGIIKTLNSKWTFAKALEALKSAGKKSCVKTTESLDKQAVKREIPEAEMAAFGLRVDYPEDFGIEAKRAEEAPEKKTSAS